MLRKSGPFVSRVIPAVVIQALMADKRFRILYRLCLRSNRARCYLPRRCPKPAFVRRDAARYSRAFSWPRRSPFRVTLQANRPIELQRLDISGLVEVVERLVQHSFELRL